MWLQRQYDLVKSKLPANDGQMINKDHVISENHVMSHDKEDVTMSSEEDHVIQDCCARTEPVRLNRKRPHQLLWQHQATKKQLRSTRWPLGKGGQQIEYK